MMKTLQIESPGSAVWKEVPMPDPGPGEVLIKVQGVTTCPHWDMHIMDGEPMFPGHKLEYPYLPGQPGHEATGEVVGLGAGVEDLKVGDRVVAWQDTGQPRAGFYAQFNVFPARSLLVIPDRLKVAENRERVFIESRCAKASAYLNRGRDPAPHDSIEVPTGPDLS